MQTITTNDLQQLIENETSNSHSSCCSHSVEWLQQAFDSIDVKRIHEDVFTLVGENYGILTAGISGKYNSMVTSWGGWGIVFGKLGVFHFLRSNRYTLELMRLHSFPCHSSLKGFRSSLRLAVCPFSWCSVPKIWLFV